MTPTIRIGIASFLLAPWTAQAAMTEVLPLSGMGKAGEAPVYWDFQLDSGRGSGEWKKIVVPSQWEQQGFGTYYYGTQGRGKPDDDPVIPKETGTYKRTFEIPKSWEGRDIHVVFEAAMTDTSVTINGKSAGPTHQGGFYRFSHDITYLLRPGTNQIEVKVSKESSNTSVNLAERRGDYWTFGGLYRPVWLEARPRNHIAWTAIDARADGSFTAQLHFDEPVPRNTYAVAQILDADGKPLGEPLRVLASRKDQIELRGTFPSPRLWTAETPHLHAVKFTLEQSSKTLHELTQRFGFRTVEVRENDGVYLNGRKIVLKGVNRHSFRPASGRTLTREENYADARLIQSMNMNAVRMSHYPPDPAFLEACDELGLYVLNELAGWQGSYDTPTGARLIGQIVRRDVNHPSILFWDNGNEGGWNTDNDGEFAKWDPQKRKVLHPWAIHDGINTDHYENYESTKKLSAGPQIFMPTEFLHGLYDGGIGAGFEDYWKVMGSSPTVAGGFFWAFADECVERSDQNRRIDCVGNAAPDGIVGPAHEKEGSYFTVKQIWSPVQVSGLRFAPRRLELNVGNRYDFLSLEGFKWRWRALRLPAGGRATEFASGELDSPAIPARTSQDWQIPVPVERLTTDEIIEVEIAGRSGSPLWKWAIKGESAVAVTPPAAKPTARAGELIRAGAYSLRFDKDTGELAELWVDGKTRVPLRGPHLSAWKQTPPARSFTDLGLPVKLRKLTLWPANKDGALARARYEGVLREVVWTLDGEELVIRYEFAHSDEVDILGMRFEFPAEEVLGRRWAGAGPYRVWKNRMLGPTLGLHEVRKNDPVPGESFDYPEFAGFFGEWRWLQMQTRAGDVLIRNLSGIPFFGQHRAQSGKQPVLELPDLGWSFLHAIAPIGTKFTRADVLGPQSQSTSIDGTIRGEIAIRITP